MFDIYAHNFKSSEARENKYYATKKITVNTAINRINTVHTPQQKRSILALMYIHSFVHQMNNKCVKILGKSATRTQRVGDAERAVFTEHW